MPSLATTMAKLGTGQSLDFSAPLHAAFVHVPLAFLEMSFFLNSLQVLPHDFLAKFIFASGVFPETVDFEETAGFLGDICGKVGVLGAIPAVLTGAAELITLLQSRAYKPEFSQNYRALKVRTVLVHAGLMDLALLVGIWNWWASRGADKFGEKLPEVNAWVSAVAFPILLFSAHLGGKLAYEYGMGVKRQGQGLKLKDNYPRNLSDTIR